MSEEATVKEIGIVVPRNGAFLVIVSNNDDTFYDAAKKPKKAKRIAVEVAHGYGYALNDMYWEEGEDGILSLQYVLAS